MELFHGSHSNTAPVIRVDKFVMDESNCYDGIFAGTYGAAASHGSGYIYVYEVDDNKIASSNDLDREWPKVIEFIREKYSYEQASEDDVYAIAYRAVWESEFIDNSDEDPTDAKLIQTRLGNDFSGAYAIEFQRIRGRIAAHLGYDAVEMSDEHGTSWLIVNPKITGTPYVTD